MILAAGRGSRMQQLTEKIPKPLLRVNNKTLIEYRVEALVSRGISNIVINVHYYADHIMQLLGNGARFGASIVYSQEKTLLEVGGGIYHALPLLGDGIFMTMNADLWTDFSKNVVLPPTSLAHLIFVDNPAHHPLGDYALSPSGQVIVSSQHRLTFSGIAFYHPDFFKDCVAESFPLKALLEKRLPEGVITGEHYTGLWRDVGTPERLAMCSNSSFRL